MAIRLLFSKGYSMYEIDGSQKKLGFCKGRLVDEENKVKILCWMTKIELAGRGESLSISSLYLLHCNMYHS
ncbi:MAG: hypothetical protein FWE03_03050 [Firmicutes bacterium]|nr:hypothetical protein [Bacillota bacterium]